MKNQDNNFKRALLKELTGFSYKEKEGDEDMADEDDDFEFVPMNTATAEPTSAANTMRSEPATSYSFGQSTTAAATATTTATNEVLATTSISKATVINGGVQTRENIIVEGIVNGDIISKGKVMIKGRVEGNISGHDVDISCEELTGDINCESKTVIHAATKLKGNLLTGRATIVGTVEGNIVAKENIELLDNAVVYGDIKASSISVSEGAVIYGMVTIGKSKPEGGSF
ncbi:polymer-forming cytoskeletal protein [Paludicola sp. MB14-C6]|uniref:bactofilin family protein n=1 Tax=Paludihabitans sp. MB14-C6 TaxID=3070656 RepID=UPI0027DC1450|nr:polymer-forming cytoskeletal protein [Paludicola sp. MB14-C6]WMJ24211.1 polymer-forming cytoskeletal protein [Paludicola sp. MB14-C6]